MAAPGHERQPRLSIRAEIGERVGEFVAELDDRLVGELTVRRRARGVLELVHTGVEPAVRRRGIGRMLVHAAADYAREHELTVVPICTYAARVFDEEPELADLLASGSRPG